MKHISVFSFFFVVFLVYHPFLNSQASEPDIFLISVDTLRADYLGCYGNPDVLTPSIDRIAKSGRTYLDTMTTIGKTGPAFASLFTSHFPLTTGAKRNGMRLRPDLPVLAELLGERGYRTAAILSNWTLRDRLSGLRRGFDTYNEEMQSRRRGPMAKEKSAVMVTKLASTCVKKIFTTGPRPLFLWVHYSDPHAPYEQHDDCPTLSEQTVSSSPDERKRDLYRKEVRYSDYWIGRFMESLVARRRTRPSLLIFTSDHGESLGEHDTWGHGGNVLQPNLHIPLIMSGIEIRPGQLDSTPASIIDVMPTILTVMDTEKPFACQGIDLLSGDLTVDAKDRLRFAFADRGLKILFHAPKARNPLQFCAVSHAQKVIYTFSSENWLHYDLISDPEEDSPESGAGIDHDVDIKKIKNQAETWYDTLPKYAAKEDFTLSEEDQDRLKSLGYLE